MKYEIIRKSMVLEGVEVNLLESGHCYLQRVTTRYRQFFLKKKLIYIFLINLTIARGNALQIAPNYAKLS